MQDKIIHAVAAAVLAGVAVAAPAWLLPIMVNHAYWASREAMTIEHFCPLLPKWHIHLGRGWLWRVTHPRGFDGRRDYAVSMLAAGTATALLAHLGA